MKILLDEKRADLIDNYLRIFDLIADRRKIVEEIFKLKKGQFAFNPDVEILIFQKPFFKKLSIKESLVFSLLIEDHASSYGDYPKWSERIHLKSSKNQLFEMINPLLLKTISLNDYLKLDLRPEFQDLLG